MNLRAWQKHIIVVKNYAQQVAGINLLVWQCRNWLVAKACETLNLTLKCNRRSYTTTVERKNINKQQNITSDQLIQLNSAHALKRGAPLLRRVGFRCPDTGRHYVFLTNNFKLSSAKIAAIYKDRWQVELFFKAITKLENKDLCRHL